MTNLVPVEREVTLLRNDPFHPDAREELVLAKRAAVDGDAAGAAASDPFYRECADHISRALSFDHTLRKYNIAEGMERSASWVSQLLKWREKGYPAGGPFAEGNAKKRKRKPSVRTKDPGPVQLSARISRDLTRLQSDLLALSNYLQQNPQGNLFSDEDEAHAKAVHDAVKKIRQILLVEGEVA